MSWVGLIGGELSNHPGGTTKSGNPSMKGRTFFGGTFAGKVLPKWQLNVLYLIHSSCNMERPLIDKVPNWLQSSLVLIDE